MTNHSAYRKSYKVRLVGDGGAEITIPMMVLEKEASRYGLSVEEFIQKFRAIAHFNSFDGIYYRFEPAQGETRPIPRQVVEADKEGIEDAG